MDQHHDHIAHMAHSSNLPSTNIPEAHHHEMTTDPTNPHSMHHMMMQMYFHGGYEETILFEFWKIDSLAGLIISMFGIFIMGALYEGLKYYREYLFWRAYNSIQYRSVTLPGDKTSVNEETQTIHMGEVSHRSPPTMLSWMHAYQTILHIIQIFVSYLLMLIFMTFNSWLCLAIIAGAATGYFLFGWKKSVIVDVTEHCH